MTQGALFHADEDQSWVTPYEFSKAIGVTAQAVLNAIRAERFDHRALKVIKTKNGSGKEKYQINLFLGKAQWDRNKNGNNSGAILDKIYNDAKRREAIARASIEEMKAEELAGQLIRVSDIKNEILKIAANVRDGFMNESQKLAPELVGLSDVKYIENKLRERFTLILEELCDAAENGRLHS